MKRIITLLTLCLTLLGASSLSLEKKEVFLKELQNSSSSLHKTKTYMLKKGWNTLTTPKSGIIVPKTFDISTVKLVVAYDKKSKLWATF